VIHIHKPSDQQIQIFLTAQRVLPFNYAAVGATQRQPPAGYAVDHNRVQVGVGQTTFEAAKAAIRRWQMFDLGWVQLCWPIAPLVLGTTVGVLANAFGGWTLNACRIVYLVDEMGEEDGLAVERFGFAYGTLPGHLARGEERFMVEWRQDNDTVWYDILAFSQPNHWLARLGYPIVRQFQKRFARDSKRAMVSGGCSQINR